MQVLHGPTFDLPLRDVVCDGTPTLGMITSARLNTPSRAKQTSRRWRLEAMFVPKVGRCTMQWWYSYEYIVGEIARDCQFFCALSPWEGFSFSPLVPYLSNASPLTLLRLGLAARAAMPWPFCPSCGTVLDPPESGDILCGHCGLRSSYESE